MHINIHMHLSISEMNSSNDARIREELGFCYYMVLILTVLLFDHGLGLAIHVYCKLKSNH